MFLRCFQVHVSAIRIGHGPTWLIVVAWLLWHGLEANAQAPLEKLRLVYSAIAGSQASFWIPYEAGIFRKHGLDVELLYVSGGGRAAQVVQSGEVPIGTFTGGDRKSVV